MTETELAGLRGEGEIVPRIRVCGIESKRLLEKPAGFGRDTLPKHDNAQIAEQPGRRSMTGQCIAEHLFRLDQLTLSHLDRAEEMEEGRGFRILSGRLEQQQLRLLEIPMGNRLLGPGQPELRRSIGDRGANPP